MTSRFPTLVPIFAAAVFSLSTSAFAASDLDPTWSPPSGYTVTTPGVSDAMPSAIALDSIGRVVVAGYAHPAPSSASQFAVVRYTGDNDPGSTGFEDASFGSGGIATVNIGAGPATANAVAIGPGNSVIVAGDCMDPSGSQYRSMCLVRFTSSGALDQSFGSTGRTVAQIGLDDSYAKAMAVDSSGRILVAGYSSLANGTVAFTIARFSANGNLDGSFASGGYRTFADPAGGVAFAYAMAIDSDGKIVLAGSVSSIANPNGAFAAIRLLATGAADPAFNGGNIATFAFQNGGGANAVTIDAAHRPVLAGVANPVGMGSSTMALVRYASSGLADATFGTAGGVSTALPGCTEAVATAIKVDGGGRYFVGGSCRTTQPVLALAHYNANGSLDSAYGSNGYSAERFGSQAGITALLMDAKTRPLVVGYDRRIANNFYAFVINRHDALFSHGME